MKKFLILILFVIAGAAQAQTVNIPISKAVQTRNGKQFYVHTVQNGQTVYSIAKAYHVAIDEIYYYNPSAKTGILVGQRLLIPDVNMKTSASKKRVGQKNFDFFYHVASAGETIDHIASIYLIPKKYILLANPGLKGPLKEGEFVKIPVEDAYKILDGEEIGKPATGSSPPGGDLNSGKQGTGNLPVEKAINEMENTPAPQVEGVSKPQNTRSLSPNSRIPIIENYRHVVMRGETMQSIARKYKISVGELRAVNPGVMALVRGEQLRLPVNAQVPGYHPSKAELEKAKAAFHHPAASGNNKNHLRGQASGEKYIVHIVKKKETLYSISRKYGVSLNEIYKANKNLTTTIRIGQKILIPKKKINRDYVFYSPTKRTRLKKVAKLYQISYQKVKENNPSLKRFVLPGELVKIPAEKVTIIVPLAPGHKEETISRKGVIKENREEQPVFRPGCTPSIHNRTFNVAVMVPLYLGQTDSLNRVQFMMQQQQNFEPFRFVQFLEGALLASQSLKARGMNLQLYVYDVDQNLTKTSKVLSQPELRNMDLIIGPFYSRSFHEVSLFAGHFHIPIVNPLTFRESVLSLHNGVIKVKPGFSFEPELIKNLVKNYYSGDKVFLINPSAFTNTVTVAAFRDSIQEELPDSVKFANSRLVKLGITVTQREKIQEQTELVTQLKAQQETEQDSQQDNQNNNALKQAETETDSLLQVAQRPIVTTINDTLRPYFMENKFIQPDSLKTKRIGDSTAFANDLIQINYMQDSLHPFMDNASVLRKNLVIVYGSNKAYIMDVMNRLNVISDTFDVKMIGVPDWETISNLDDYQMSKLNVTYPASYYVNYSSSDAQALDSTFVKYFGTIPQKYGFLGYDITCYFLDALYRYGKQMERCLPDDPYQGISTKFQFVPSPQNNNSYVNKYWNIIRIKDMHLSKLPDSTFTDYYRWFKTVQNHDSIR